VQTPKLRTRHSCMFFSKRRSSWAHTSSQICQRHSSRRSPTDRAKTSSKNRENRQIFKKTSTNPDVLASSEMDDGHNKCTDSSRLWPKCGQRKIRGPPHALPCAGRITGKRARKCASRHCRKIPAPLLKGGGEAQRRKPLAHADRKIQVGRGALARQKAMLVVFLYISFVIRPSRKLVQLPGFFFEKIKKESLKTLCTSLDPGALANAHCGKGAICCRTWPDHLFIWPFQKWIENHAPQFR
jgi:hypothetical protein